MTKANGDDYCSYNTRVYDLLRDQIVTSCADISWDSWELDKSTKNKPISEQKMVRKGTGTKTIIDYRKKKLVYSKTESRYVGDGQAFNFCFEPVDENCKGLPGTLNNYDKVGSDSYKIYEKHAACYNTFGYIAYLNSRRITIKETKVNKKTDRNLRNDSTANVYRTNKVCQVRQTDDLCKIKPETEGCNRCKAGPWSPDPSTKCKGIKFTQDNDCEKRDAIGAKKCEPNYCKLYPTASECVVCKAGPWSPNPSTKCKGIKFTQDNDCEKRFDVEGTKECGNNFCDYHPTDESCQSDDTTITEDDDETAGDDFVETDADAQEESHERVQIDAGLAWSKSKSGPWSTDFDKLILLKSKKDYIYIKVTPEEGVTCNWGPSDIFPLYDSSIDILGIKEYLGIDTIKTNTSENLIYIKPTNNVENGKVYKDGIKVNYCASPNDNEKTLKFKVVDIVQQEI